MRGRAFSKNKEVYHTRPKAPVGDVSGGVGEIMKRGLTHADGLEVDIAGCDLERG